MNKNKIFDLTTILQVEDLQVSFTHHGQETRAVDGINLSLHRGESIGIVGESGSGKSVTALSIMNLLNSPPALIKSGKINFRSETYGIVDCLSISEQKLRSIRGNEIAMIFQEPMSSLNPVFTCGNQVAEALKTHMKLNNAEARAIALGLFEEVKLPRPDKITRPVSL